MCKFLIEALDMSYFCAMFQNMLSNSIHETPSGYYYMKDMCLFSIESEIFGWDVGMVWDHLSQ